MKIKFLFAVCLLSCFLIPQGCEERVVNKTSGIRLTKFKSERQSPTKTKVTMEWTDADTATFNYIVQLYDIDTIVPLLISSFDSPDTTATYPNLDFNKRYRHIIRSQPSSDSLRFNFLIGTMGDVDIQMER